MTHQNQDLTETIIVEIYNDNTASIRTKNKTEDIVVDKKHVIEMIVDVNAGKKITWNKKLKNK